MRKIVRSIIDLTGILAILLLILSTAANGAEDSGAEDSGAEDSGAEDIAVEVRASQRQIFLEDLGIAKIEKLMRTIRLPQKRGAILRNANSVQSRQRRIASV